MLENSRGKRTRVARNIYPYSGILVCGTCGNAYKANRGNRTLSYSYVCRGRKEKGICKQPSFGSGRIDTLLRNGLRQGLECELDTLKGSIDGQMSAQRQTDRNTSRLRDLKDSRIRVVDLYTSGIIDKPELEGRIAVIDQQMKQLALQPYRSAFATGDVMGLLDSWDDTWGNLSDLEKRSLVLSLCGSIIVKFVDKNITLEIQSFLAKGHTTIVEPLGR
jgi:hypothetical protein